MCCKFSFVRLFFWTEDIQNNPYISNTSSLVRWIMDSKCAFQAHFATRESSLTYVIKLRDFLRTSTVLDEHCYYYYYLWQGYSLHASFFRTIPYYIYIQQPHLY
jgi:hypothetical protein